MRRWLYSLAIHALLPWALLHLLWRARKQPEYLRHWGERFGHYAPPARPASKATHHNAVSPPPTFWIHAVSVGETRAAAPLIKALRQRYPGHRIILTHMTPTGRATSAALFGDSVERVYLPYDTPWAVHRFLRHFQPQIGLIMETELWPNLINACHEQKLPLLLVNARMSEKSARRYARFAGLTRGALQQLAAIAAIGADDAARLTALGAPAVDVFGNVKFDIEAPAQQPDFRRLIGTRPVFLCASTREGEEARLLDAWRLRNAQKVDTDKTAAAQLTALTAGLSRNALLVIVPRHPQRFDEVARLIEARGMTLQRRSANAPVAANTEVWLGDSMGELFAYYAAASDHGVAFVGGSLLDFGCQNLIEPCAVGTPVLLGPSVFNFADAARNALAEGAAMQAADAVMLVQQALTLLDDPTLRQGMSDAALAFAARHRGATARTLALIARYKPTPS